MPSLRSGHPSMKQQIQTMLQQAIVQLQTEGSLPAELSAKINIERTRDSQHGDFASNIALILGKTAGMAPRQFAEKLIAALPSLPWLAKVEIAGPGFINFFLTDTATCEIIEQILSQAEQHGRAAMGERRKVHMEFVSANPTGPLHVGHGRGAAYGSAVGNLLEAVGYHVHREYYVNDAGRQMDILAVSVWLRYLALCDETIYFPENGYKGDYVVEIAQNLLQHHQRAWHQPAAEIFAGLVTEDIITGTGDKEANIDALIDRAKTLLGESIYADLHAASFDAILADIREDLAEFAVHYQQWFSEKQLVTPEAIAKTLQQLDEQGHTYEKAGAIWFRTTALGDDKDRVLVRKNGQATYFTSDILYHADKFARGFDWVINILGADHHGYIPRLKAAIAAVGNNIDDFSTPIVQFATLYRGKERVQMSTRSGSFVTLRELREEVGTDAARFFYVSRKSEQHMDFDLELAKSQSNDNPVYYVQYAHARICSVFAQLADKQWSWDEAQGLASLALLETAGEKTLMVKLARYAETIVSAGTGLAPHILAHYLCELANDFHSYYNAQQFLVEEATLRNARLCLIAATRQILVNGLHLLGVTAPESM